MGTDAFSGWWCLWCGEEPVVGNENGEVPGSRNLRAILDIEEDVSDEELRHFPGQLVTRRV